MPVLDRASPMPSLTFGRALHALDSHQPIRFLYLTPVVLPAPAAEVSQTGRAREPTRIGDNIHGLPNKVLSCGESAEAGSSQPQLQNQQLNAKHRCAVA